MKREEEFNKRLDEIRRAVSTKASCVISTDKIKLIRWFEHGAVWADEHPKNPWISVEDRLPEVDKDGKSDYCLARRFDGGLYAAKYFAYRERWAEEDQLCEWIDGITHWMPIPELPKGEQQ